MLRLVRESLSKPWRFLALGLLFSHSVSATTVERTADEFVYASKNVFTWKTAAIFGTGIAATVASTSLDGPLFESFTHRNHGLWVDFGNFWGTPFPAIGLFAATLVVPDSPRFQRFGESLAAAMISSTVLTGILKYSFGRRRPSGTNNLSLPSGHTTVAFTLAAVLEQHYGWGVGVPAYALAVVTAAARIADGAHWLSDTVLGATIAIGVSEWFRRSHDSDVAVLPYAFEHVPTGDMEYGVRFHVPLTL
jgi:membrane-associated phospholipid phosphatase